MQPSDQIKLPVGLEIDGIRYRDVVIDERCGVDDENAASRKIKNNGAKAMTVVLRRIIQGIPGLVEQKKDPYSLIEARYVREMFAVDRDSVFIGAMLLGADAEFTQESRCPSCNAINEDVVDPHELDVYEWPEDQPAELNMVLPVGVRDGSGALHREFVWRFPTGLDQEKLAAVPRNTFATTLIATCCKKLGSLDRRPDTEAIRRMKSRDRAFLLNTVRHQMPGIDLRLDCACEACGQEWDGDVDLTRLFSMESAGTKRTTPGGSRSLRKLRKRESDK